jgi:hypothetical protein
VGSNREPLEEVTMSITDPPTDDSEAKAAAMKRA